MIARQFALHALVATFYFAPSSLLLVREVTAEQFVLLSLAKDQEIATLSFNDQGADLQVKSRVETAGQPGAMCIDPKAEILYVAMRGDQSIAAYQIGKEAKLTHIGDVNVNADGSYVSVDPSGKYLLTAYYGASQVTVHGIKKKGSLSSKPIQTIKTDEKAHAVVFDRAGKFVFVPHTRPNTIFQFRFDSATGKLAPNEPLRLKREADSGPRHLWFHPAGKIAFGSDEQGSSITCYQMNDQGQLTKLQTESSLPSQDFEGANSTSDVEVHPSGKYAYIANRGHDTIAAFSVAADTGRMKRIGNTPTEAVTRSFNISSDGKFLAAAGQKTGKLAMFRIQDNGQLKRISTTQIGVNPWWVLILPSGN